MIEVVCAPSWEEIVAVREYLGAASFVKQIPPKERKAFQHFHSVKLGVFFANELRKEASHDQGR